MCVWACLIDDCSLFAVPSALILFLFLSRSCLCPTTAPAGDGQLQVQCFHSLDAAKCLMSLDVSCPRCPHSLKIRIPDDWEAGMYSLVLGKEAHAGGGENVATVWKEWCGILVVKPRDVEAKSICGAQALPASHRPLEAPAPPRADAKNSSPYSLCLVVEPLANPSVLRYRLMQRSDAIDEAQTGECKHMHTHTHTCIHNRRNTASCEG